MPVAAGPGGPQPVSGMDHRETGLEDTDCTARLVRAVRPLLAPGPAGAGAVAAGVAACAALPPGRHHVLGAVRLPGRYPVPAGPPPGLAARATRGGRLTWPPPSGFTVRRSSSRPAAGWGAGALNSPAAVPGSICWRRRRTPGCLPVPGARAPTNATGR